LQVASLIATQVPALQESIVQGWPSLQSASTLHAVAQVGIDEVVQTPATHCSSVQALPSSAQFASTAHAVQPGMTADAQPPATQVSVVQAFESSQSASVVQGAQPPATKLIERSALSLTLAAFVANAVATFV
jgi:hypothetical protein